MKKITFLLLVLLSVVSVSYGQVSAYSFNQSSGTYTPLTGGNVLGIATGNAVGTPSLDNEIYTVNLPFSFSFNGNVYTECVVTSNGYITFGSTLPAGTLYTPISSTTNYNGAISAWGRDLNALFNLGGLTGDIIWDVIGTAPNREFVVQYRNFRPVYTTSTTTAPYINFQIVLSETSNQIKVIYGNSGLAVGTTNTSTTIQIGLRGAVNTDFNNRTNATTVLFTNSTAGTSNTSTQAYSSVNVTPGTPSDGLTYTWTPPTCFSPSGFSASAITTNSATISWNALANAPSNGYEYFVSTTNTTPTTPGVNTSSSTVNLTSLTENTTYYVWLRSDCGGSFSAWTGPFTFATSCSTVTSFTQNFDSLTTPALPPCWNKVGTLGTTNTQTTNPNSSPNTLYIYSSSATNQVTLAMQPVSNLGAGTHRLRFNMGANFTANGVIEFGYLTNPTDATTFVALGSATAATLTYAEYIITPAAGSYSNFPAFRHTGVPANSILIDDVKWEPLPSCLPPNNLATSNLTSSSVDLSWTAGTASEWEYVVQLATDSEPTSGTQALTNTVTGVPVLPNTNYKAYVRTVCSPTDISAWTVLNFTSPCASYVPTYTEDFTTFPPACWTRAAAGTPATGPSGTAAGIWLADGFLNTSGVGATKVNLYSLNRIGWLISPTIDMTAGNYRVKFDYGVTTWNLTTPSAMGSDDVVQLVASQDNGVTWTVITTFNAASNVSNTLNTFIQDLPSYTSANTRFALFATDGTVDDTEDYDFFIDNFIIETIPSTAPSCPTNIVATQDPNCGNFPLTISWNAVTGATGYKITLGTTSGGTQIENNTTIASNSYTITAPTVGQTYYYTILAYNNVGDSVGCTENSFATSSTGCYCPSVPTSNDGTGVSNITINSTTSYTVTDVTYTNFNTPVADVSRGIQNTMSITISTFDGFSSYDYDHNVWIDFNDNFIFESSELVATGVSAATSPTTLNLSFTPGATVPLGQHKMRIANADTGQVPPNPCYNGTYGNTIDLNVNIVAPSCQPVAYSSATIVANCSSNEFSVDVVVTGLGSATSPTLTDGTNSWPISATGTITAGPYASGTTNNLTITHQDNTCVVNLGSFSFICPPSNDECSSSTVLTAGGTYGEYLTDGTNSGATNSSQPNPTTCNGYSGGDVWFSVEVPASGNITIETGNSSTGATGVDTVITAYTGTCGSLTQVGCDDDGAATGAYSLLSLSGLTPGEIVLLRVYEYNNDNVGSFGISAYDSSLSNSNFDNSTFTYYPNPVKNILNLSYSQNISQVEVYNLLGQKMSSNSFETTSAQVDMSNYASGAYLVKVTSNNVTKTVRVIKE